MNEDKVNRDAAIGSGAEPRVGGSGVPSISGTPLVMSELLAELSALEAKATPGPWEADGAVDTDGRVTRAIYHRPRQNHIVEVVESPDAGGDDECIHSDGDHLFIVALRNAWPQIKAALSESESGTSVWLVLAGYDYEGEDVKACVATKEEADALAEKYQDREHFSYDNVDVVEWKVGEITDKRWEDNHAGR